jgi:hypothetical protein
VKMAVCAWRIYISIFFFFISSRNWPFFWFWRGRESGRGIVCSVAFGGWSWRLGVEKDERSDVVVVM